VLAVTLAARDRNWRRGSFMTVPPDSSKAIPIALPLKILLVSAIGT
jgi:hypothetical protein